VDEKSRGDQAVKDILLSNHPAFDNIRRILDIPYRVFFENREELSSLLKARQFEKEGFLEDWEKSGFTSWKRKGAGFYFRVSDEVFEEENLKIYAPHEWRKEWIEIQDDDDDDGLPF